MELRGYCKQQSSDYQVSIRIIDASSNETSEKYYGTFACKYVQTGNLCNQTECSILSSKNIHVGDKV